MADTRQPERALANGKIRVDFQTEPGRYRHWKLSVDGEIATILMDVDEKGSLFEGYELKLNSYDLGVDIELADALERLRQTFHYEVTKAGVAYVLVTLIIGIAALTFTNSTNSLMQLSTEPAMRGRVMAIRLAIALGGTPIGAPIVGWVADTAGPRWALGVGAAAGFAAALVGIYYLARHRHLRVRIESGRLRLRLDPH